MCENCGINHDTDDLFSMLATEQAGEEAAQEPPVSFMDERGLTPEFELSGELYGKPWTVKVAEIPLSEIEEEHKSHGSQWWALDGYYDGELVRSSEGTPPEPVTAKQAAEVFAEYHFDYVIPA